MSEKHAFINRGIAQVGEIQAYSFLDDFFQAYATAILFDGETRKAYFFDTQTVIENGGASGQNVLIGSYELNQEFHDLQGITPPANGEVITFIKGEREITAVMIPPATGLSVNTTIKGLDINVDASAIASILGVSPTNIQNFDNDGTTITFYIGITYEIPGQAFFGLPITDFIDTSGKVTKVGDEAFLSCTTLKRCNVNSATIIGLSAFEGCTNAVVYNVSGALEVGIGAFGGNISLTSLSLHSCVSIGQGAFAACEVLNTLDIPSVESVDDEFISNCVKLLALSIHSATTITDGAFLAWGGSTHTLTIPTALAANTGVVKARGMGTTIVLI